MPLFMDLHKASDYDVKPTIEEIKRNHIADLETQVKYGVKFIQYWVNEDAGLVFCLMEGPDKESCIATHQEAHGNIACNVIELKGGDYQAFMGDALGNKFDIVERKDGTLDTGRRCFLMADIFSLTDSPLPFRLFDDRVTALGGRHINHKSSKKAAVFDSPSQAVECAKTIQTEINTTKQDGIEIRMGVHAGEPVSDCDGLFGEVLQITDWLCDVSANRQISISAEVMEDAKSRLPKSHRTGGSFKVLSPSDERFLDLFMMAVQPALSGEIILIEKLSKKLGTSRAQLYRKVTSLTGHSPNNFIQELRLRKAMRLVIRKYGNVAEISFASGFNNPSYFTKSFHKRFGTLPVHLLKSV